MLFSTNRVDGVEAHDAARRHRPTDKEPKSGAVHQRWRWQLERRKLGKAVKVWVGEKLIGRGLQCSQHVESQGNCFACCLAHFLCAHRDLWTAPQRSTRSRRATLHCGAVDERTRQE